MNSRFQVQYRLACPLSEAADVANQIAFEQSVCHQPHLVAPGFLKNEIAGRIEELTALDEHHSQVSISFLSETVGNEITQLMNILYGNISLTKGIRVTDLQLSSDLKAHFTGPRFGITGIRERLGISTGALMMADIGPLGRSTNELAELTYRFAEGGVDLIIDEHLITDQSWSPFRERVHACCKAVERANAKTGRKSCYVPNITSSMEEMMLRADWAARYGAGGLLVCPGLTGFESLHRLSQSRRPGLPIIVQPAFLGSFILSPNQGISVGLLFGTIFRMAGADCVMFPIPSERFSFEAADCKDVIDRCYAQDPFWKKTLPVVGGSIGEKQLPQLKKEYGDDVIYLVGRQLYEMSANLPENVRQLRRILERET